jgi:hypothetical protein
MIFKLQLEEGEGGALIRDEIACLHSLMAS